MDIFENVPPSIMLGFNEFRESRYNFLYVCRSCGRWFDSKKAMCNCKFCNGSIIELGSKKTEKKFAGMVKKPMYRYYCPTCEKNLITTENLPMCNMCRTDYLHVYTWDTLRKRDRFLIKLNKSLRNVFSGEKGAKTKISIKIPSFSFQRIDEELPTN